MKCFYRSTLRTFCYKVGAKNKLFKLLLFFLNRYAVPITLAQFHCILTTSDRKILTPPYDVDDSNNDCCPNNTPNNHTHPPLPD